DDAADQIARGVHGVVVLLLRRLRFATRIGVVAIQRRFGQKVRARTSHDPQRTVLQPGAYGGDARALLVVALADHDADAAQLHDLAGARRIAVPGHVARQVLGVVGQRPLAAVVLARQPEHVVAVEHAPD